MMLTTMRHFKSFGLINYSAIFQCKMNFTMNARTYSSNISLLKGLAISPLRNARDSTANKAKQDLKMFSSAYHNAAAMKSNLKAVFEPKSVAIIGATDRAPSVGRTLVQNLISGISAANTPCKIYAVNPSRKAVLDLACYPSVLDIPDEIDMAVIVSPAKSCLKVMEQCAEKKVKAAVVISAGFKEAGPDGVALENELVNIARQSNIRVIGPNCVGMMNPNYGLNATFAATMGLPGNVAFISQSGAMCTAILDWSIQEKIGFSAFVSVGSMADVHWGDLLEYLGSDQNTKSIIIYMEAIGDAEAFLKAAEKVAMKKPISVIKAGKSDAAAQAAASHTGSLAGSYSAFQAAMDKCGVLTTNSIQELADITSFLSKQPQPGGPRLTIITNAGGPAVLATDAAVLAGAEIAELSPNAIEELNKFLPPSWSHSNPVDILGDASAELYARTLEVLMNEPNQDGILVVLSPQDVTDPLGTAKALVESMKISSWSGKKPVFAAWMGGETVKKGSQILTEAGIPVFAQPDTAASVYGKLWNHKKLVQKLYSFAPNESSTISTDKAQKKKARDILEKIQSQGRTLLTERESKELLSFYEIASTESILAKNVDECMEAVKKLKSPLYVVKVNSETLTHKSDVGGVMLNVKAADVTEAFKLIQKNVTKMHGSAHFGGVTVQPMIDSSKAIELILGSSFDPQFGPVLLFGSGGLMVEIFKDTALAIPPLDDTLVEALMEQTKIYKALKGGNNKRFAHFDITDLRNTLMRFSHMVTDLADLIQEVDINPFLATPNNGYIALDARVILKKPSENRWVNHSQI